MKISEFIKILEEEKEKRGDLEILFLRNPGFDYDPECTITVAGEGYEEQLVI